MNAPTRDLRAKVWARDELDHYVEPESVTTALLGVERFVGAIHDPCCGLGNVVRAARAAGYEATGGDIVRRCGDAPWFNGECDFRQVGYVYAPNIVMNPPFFRAKGAEEFIRKALKLAKGKVAAFVDIRFIAGAERANGLYSDFPPHRIWIVTPRVSCPPGSYLAAGNKAGNGSSDWVWMVWDRLSPPPSAPELRWLKDVGKAASNRRAEQ